MKISGAIFDLDGTLFETMDVWNGLGERYLVSKGISPRPDTQKKIAHLSITEAITYLKESYHLSDTIDTILFDVQQLIADGYEKISSPKVGVEDFLQLLYRQGIPLGVATATDYQQAISLLKRTNLELYFQGVYTCDEVGCGKEAPDIFYYVQQKLGSPLEKTVVFEDSYHAIVTAKKAGFPTIGIADVSTEDQQEKIKAVADQYWESFVQGEKIFNV